jgi:hypothetical protein
MHHLPDLSLNDAIDDLNRIRTDLKAKISEESPIIIPGGFGA